jgi:predicted RNA-binding Zn-ribbon protein involved in translation (DUF1610 family)
MGRVNQKAFAMSTFDPRLLSPLSRGVRTDCPNCRGSLTVMRVIPGRESSEYWTMRCTRCGGIHLDIIEAVAEPVGA